MSTPPSWSAANSSIGVGRLPSVSRLILFNKPYGVLSQFRDSDGRSGLARYLPVPGVYAAGRLDADSEGLLVLTDDGALQHRIADPRHKLAKRYWVQVEGMPGAQVLAQLAGGVDLGDYRTQACEVRSLDSPQLWDRVPPIRVRKAIPTTWLEIRLREGKNRQIRRMTARIGFPTLRLVRVAVGDWTLGDIEPGGWRELTTPMPIKDSAVRR